jgi:hypothetical protein
MKNKTSKGSKKSSHAKPPRATSAKQCECCGDAPCTCPPSHGHKMMR